MLRSRPSIYFMEVAIVGRGKGVGVRRKGLNKLIWTSVKMVLSVFDCLFSDLAFLRAETVSLLHYDY